MTFRTLFVVVLAAVSGGVPPTPAAASSSARAAALSPTSLTVTWQGTSPPADWWFVGATSTADGAFQGSQRLCGTCLSTRFDYLAPATTYTFTIVGVGGGAGAGKWLSGTGTTPADPLCPSGSTCVAVDADAPVGSAAQPGLGLNQGITERTDMSKLTALKLNYHRIAAWNKRTFDLARTAGGEIEANISGAWRGWTRTAYGVEKDPWDDWTTYQAFVSGVVKWHRQNNRLPDYWDIQNEPDQADWYAGTTTAPTAGLVLQQFQIAHDTIRAVLPDAKIIAPSVGSFEPMSRAVIDLRTVLDYAAAHGLRYDVISWHELGGDCGGRCDGGPRGIAQHIATLKNVLAAYPQLGQPPIHINEYGENGSYDDPGMAVGYFAAMAASGIRRGASACWPQTYDGVTYNTCYANPGQADGLLRPDGQTPTAKYLVWQAFAKMTGTVVASNVSRPDMSVVAVRGSDGTIRLMVGRHATTAAAPAMATVQIRIKPPAGARNYTASTVGVVLDATAEHLDNLGAVRVADGMLDLGSFTLANGSSLTVNLVPR